MNDNMISTPFKIGTLELPHRLIQGPLAGFSCAPFRQMFSKFLAPAYCVSEMISAHDVLNKHALESRYLVRSPLESLLCYQISGHDPDVMAAAAAKLEGLGADLIDINCGCPKAKIRKKGAGSALLEQPDRLVAIIQRVRAAIACPLTVKIRLQGGLSDLDLAKKITDAGADALIVHGRRWTDDYDVPCDYQQIAKIKQAVTQPVIMNGDINDKHSLQRSLTETGCDAFMIARGATGKPWLYQALLTNSDPAMDQTQLVDLFMTHLHELAKLENEYLAVLQSKSLVRYYFRDRVDSEFLKRFYTTACLEDIEYLLTNSMLNFSRNKTGPGP
jgi:nifR3 family TIM-barrel protein